MLEYIDFKPVHMFGGSRLVCRFRHVDTGTVLNAFFQVTCSCPKRFPSYACTTWMPKGRSSSLCRAAEVMYGRGLRKGDDARPTAIFKGRLVRVSLGVVEKDSKENALAPESQYSRIGAFLAVVAGGGQRRK